MFPFAVNMRWLPLPIISASLSPNTESGDRHLAFAMLFQPWKWRTGKRTKQVEDWFESNFPGFRAVTFNSGRSALYAILHAFGIGAGDDVLIQSFTCVAVPNSVLWTGANPIYVDTDDSLNIDTEDARKKITPKTRAIVVQHTFGVCARMEKICEFAEEHKILLIEDCAHSLGAAYRGQKAGTFGDAAFFSFGRDKIVSSVFGGTAIIRSNHTAACKHIGFLHDGLAFPSMFWILQQLLHPVLFSLILPLYTIGAGKLLLYLAQRLGVLSFPVYTEEKSGGRPAMFPAKYPDALAVLILRQLSKIDRYNRQRIRVSRYYQDQLEKKQGVTLLHAPDGSIFLRYSVLVQNPSSYYLKAKKQGILLGNWYHNGIDPTGVDFPEIRYHPSACPHAQYTAQHILNLPTRLTKEEAARVVKCFS
jgi:perosamine synthetase